MNFELNIKHRGYTQCNLIYNAYYVYYTYIYNIFIYLNVYIPILYYNNLIQCYSNTSLIILFMFIIFYTILIGI